MLYRSNAQSRVLEHQLFTAGVPYRVYGGLRFFDRQGVKHATPWLVIGESNHPIECRLCLGFWVSLLVCLCTSPPELITINVLPVYGASYFLATQER